MIISEVRPRRRRLYMLVLDGQDGPSVDRQTFDESGFRVGSGISEQQLADLLTLSQYNRAREKALYLLGLRDYGCRELERKLALEVPLPVASAVVERLKDVGLLDDEQYALRAAQSMSRYKQYPRRRIVQELVKRGIARALAEDAANAVEPEDFEQALALIQKKYYNKMTTPQARQRVMAALARQGFSYDAVRRAMESFHPDAQTDLEETEEQWL